jgi:NADH-quinone oxidoreductase subunit C
VPYTHGPSLVAEPKPKRFSLSYHLLALRDEPMRLRLQAWLNDGETAASAVEVWPAADWLEREVFDLLGIVFEGHPNLVRILTPEDWEGHPLRKDYPVGGEPVRFSEEA